MSYEKKAIASVNAKLESAIKELEAISTEEISESIESICAKIKESMTNLDALSNENE